MAVQRGEGSHDSFASCIIRRKTSHSKNSPSDGLEVPGPKLLSQKPRILNAVQQVGRQQPAPGASF